MTQTEERTVPYETWKREHEARLKAEQKLDEAEAQLEAYIQEFFLQREIRQAPVIQPIAKDILEECWHTQHCGMVDGPGGSKRVNFKTIAKNLKSSSPTIKRHAERMQKLGIIEIHELQGPEDEDERKYIHVPVDRLRTIGQLQDPEKVQPDRGGNRYICLNEKCGSTNVSVRKVTHTTLMIHCHECEEDTSTEEVEDTGWKMQNGHKTQKQLDFGNKSKLMEAIEAREAIEQAEHEAESQLGYRSVDTCAMPPEWLRNKKIWCPWRYEEPKKPRSDGKLDKIPYQTSGRVPQKADVGNAATWSTYDQAHAIYEASLGWKRPFAGIGMMCDGSFVGIDLDHCWDPKTGEFSDWALAIVARFASYTYVTPNRGLRIVILAKKPGTRCKKGDIEIYEERRFFTWTPERLDGTPDEIADDCQAELDAFYKEVFPTSEKPATNSGLTVSILPCSTSDETILKKARGAANGATFIRLYDKGDITGYPSQSEAELALCEFLSYWGAGGDVSTIDRLFRLSPLMRPKWDEPARSGETYGEGTMRRAIQMAGWQVAV